MLLLQISMIFFWLEEVVIISSKPRTDPKDFENKIERRKNV